MPAFSPYRLLVLLMIILLVLNPKLTFSNSCGIHKNVETYVLEKLKTHDVVFLGTSHNKPRILQFISDLIPKLHGARVTHLGLEIASDQQYEIGQFMKTGAGLNGISIHPQIDCPEYRNLFNVIRSLIPDKRPVPVALDLPKSKYKEKISRDEWIARSIANVFKTNSNAKMLVVVGNNHVFKKLDWQDHVVNSHRSIREYLTEKIGNLRIFSIGQVIGESVYEDDFRREFGHIDGIVAVDLDERFTGWKLGVTQSVAIKPRYSQ